MARKYHLTREDANKLVKQLRSKKYPQLIVVAISRELNQFTILPLEEVENSKTPIIMQKPIYRILQDIGVWDKVRGSDLDEIYEYLPKQVWEKVEDSIYQEINTYLSSIKRLGYVPTAKEGRTIENITKIVNEGVKDKYSKLSKINKVSKQQLKMSDEEWHLFSTSGSRDFIGEDGLERDSIFNAFQNAGIILKENKNIEEDEELVKGVQYFNTILDRVSRAQKTHIDILYEGFRGLVQRVGREKNETALYYIEKALSLSVNRRLRFETKVREAMQFSEKYNKYTKIKTIQPIIHNNTPYILVEGDLDKMDYFVTEGRNYVSNPVSRARGVTELEGDNNGVKKYRVTLNAFRDISINDEYEDKYIIHKEGEWDKYYETGSKVSLKLTPAFVREVDHSVQLTVVTYNANRAGMNALGQAIPFSRTDVFEYGKMYDNADSVYEDIEELYGKLTKGGYTHNVISEWKRGYDIRNGNTEKLDEYKDMADTINTISKQLEPEVVEAVNAHLGTNYTSISQIRDHDFGLDSGFSYIDYVDNGKLEEAKALQDHASGEVILPERAITFIPRVQSVTIKDFIGNRFIKKVNEQLPKEWELTYYSRLD